MSKKIQIKQPTINEDKLIGSSIDEIELIFGVPEYKKQDESVYIMKKSCSELFKQRLYLFYYKGKVRDFYVGI